MASSWPAVQPLEGLRRGKSALVGLCEISKKKARNLLHVLQCLKERGQFCFGSPR